MIPNVARQITDWVQGYVRDQLNALENRQARVAQGLRYFPQVVTTDMTIPEGRQLVIDRLDIAEGATLTLEGHLRVLSGIRNLGHLKITSTGSLHNG